MPSFLPVLKNFTVNPGVPFDYSFTYYQGVPTSQYPVDLTSATASLVIRNSTGAPLLTLASGAVSPANGIYFGGSQRTPTNGIIDIVISAASTAAISWKYGRYVMTLTTQAFGQQSLLYGSFVMAGFTP